MDTWLSWLATQGFLPHGYCLQWSSGLLQLMVASDFGIAAAYFSIPVALVSLSRRRPDWQFGWVFGLFSLFIFSCGATHVMGLLNIWWPLYWLEGGIKAITAVASIVTAAALWPLLPKLAALPSTSQLEDLVARLQREIEVRKDAERRLQALTVELEARVADRTRELEQEMAERLRLQDADRARDVAERASQAKSEFLSRMSHEVRTPLNAVLGFSQLLLQPGALEDRGKAVEWVGRMQDAGRHLLRLVEDVLNISQVESGRFRPQVEPVDLDEVLDECVSMLGPMAHASNVTIDVSGPQGLSVRTDGHRLRQVLLNVMSNAVKYNRRGGTVRVDVEPGADVGLQFEIADSGIGMSTAQLDQLFQPFNRLGRERGGPAGAGLGLVVVKNMVEQLGGAIAVQSQEGVGTVVRFTWPLTTDA